MPSYQWLVPCLVYHHNESGAYILLGPPGSTFTGGFEVPAEDVTIERQTLGPSLKGWLKVDIYRQHGTMTDIIFRSRRPRPNGSVEYLTPIAANLVLDQIPDLIPLPA